MLQHPEAAKEEVDAGIDAYQRGNPQPTKLIEWRKQRQKRPCVRWHGWPSLVRINAPTSLPL